MTYKLKIPAVRFKSNGTDHFGCVRPEYLGPPLKTTFNLNALGIRDLISMHPGIPHCEPAVNKPT